MKTRITSIALVLVLILALAGCGTTSTDTTAAAESKFNAGNTALAKQAISAADSYFNGRSTADDARDAIEGIRAQVDESDGNYNFLRIYLDSMSSKLLSVASGFGSSTMTDVIESRDKLAAYVGIDPY